ncbi:MAG: hypothetical protein U9Q76_07855 [candidate division WOR-3 bacterium]|nr:hypothetical protein [candidate division WOR-3 bacterium]
MNKGSTPPKRTISTNGWLIEPQLWSMESPEKTTFEIDGIVYSVEENGKRIKAKAEQSTLTKEEFKEKIQRIAEKFIDAYSLSCPKYFHLGPKPKGKSLSKVDPVIREQEEGKPAHITLNIHDGVRVGASVRFLSYDKDGKLKSDSYQTEFDQNVEVIHLSMQDETLNRLTRYFHLALRDIESLEFTGNLHKILKALENAFKKKRSEVAKELGVDKEDLNRIGKLTSADKYDQRHPPKPGEQVVQISASEVDECIKRARKVILAYVQYYKRQNS